MPLGENPDRYSRNLVSLSGSHPGASALTSTTNASFPIWSKLWGHALGDRDQVAGADLPLLVAEPRLRLSADHVDDVRSEPPA
jgi:hypothetical protein